jgi:hypothetical protein
MRALAIVASLTLAAAAFGQVERAQRVRFVAVDVYVDAGSAPLAAYQFELTGGASAKVVGVEGGENAAFREAPYYDPAALKGGRIIIAAFSTSDNLPVGRTRVATVHFQEAVGEDTPYEAALKVAGTSGAVKIEASIEVVRDEGGIE